MRIMAIDYGDARVGIALSDPLQIIGSPFVILQNDGQLFDQIEAIIRGQSVSEIIVGWPLNSKGCETVQTRKIADFAESLRSRTGLPVTPVDEDFTTADANLCMREAGISRKKKKGYRDSIAASLILQHYLETRPKRGGV
ncbi:MAG: Holliday junction resolvase RuvX [Candidatus Wallbacteria bacterium]|nr:Holliday junction resolvase RuvX [Candidatus Wallbacteria bacterium]